jgi:FMN phosphatase YigB (HAD superfamily)
MERAVGEHKLNSELVKDVEIIIFDMDGTLYRLDGEMGGFKGSSLALKMFDNTLNFVIDREDSETAARFLIDEALNDEVGMSVFFANRYQISRKDFFDVVWNIDPVGKVAGFEEVMKVVRGLKDMGKRLVLVTQAPRVWQKRVLRYLEIEDCFDEVYSGEDFKIKEDVFVEILRGNPKKVILSIGDQLETDVVPALKLGMKAFLVENPIDLQDLLK